MQIKLITLLLLLFYFHVVSSLNDTTEKSDIVSRVIVNESDDEIFVERINIAFTFTKAQSNQALIDKFRLCIKSLLKYTTTDLNIFILGDVASQRIAAGLFEEADNVNGINYKILPLDTDQLAQRMHKLVNKMQKHFSHSPSSYYGDALFFLSIGLFKILDLRIKQIILFDVDIKFQNNVKYLHEHFNNFTESNVIGIARDGQPVYRHVFWRYRSENPNTRVGSPPPNGLTGFNSGVLLLDLEKMRHSRLYESVLTDSSIDLLTNKYYFKGHLGDQDFFSLVSMEHEKLFYVLPCTWNRQLCDWWRNNGYADVFDEYYRCDGDVNIYHGNCNTPLPDDKDDDEMDVKQEL